MMDFIPKTKLDKERVLSLCELIQQCEKESVEINEVFSYLNGFLITFVGIPGDAILHDGSYSNRFYYWETISMPWDGDDVSVHDPKTLAKLLGAYHRGEEWEKYDV